MAPKASAISCNCYSRAAGPKQMSEDTEFLCLLRGWSRKAKLCNMHIERLIAQIKKGCRMPDGQRPCAEKLVSAGFMGAPHGIQGRVDMVPSFPGGVVNVTMLKSGVLVCETDLVRPPFSCISYSRLG